MDPAQPTSPSPSAAAAECVEGGSADPAIRCGFFQHRFVQKVLPFLTSLALHLGVVAVGLLMFYTAIKVVREPVRREFSPTDTDFVHEVGIQHLPGLNSDKPWLRTAQDQVPDDTGFNTAEFTASATRRELSGGGGLNDASVIAVGANAEFGLGSSHGMGKGPKSGAGTGEGIPAPFGIPADGGASNPIFVCGSRNARKIAFVCDASGSMINKMPSLKSELAKAVINLKPIQSFSIIFFQDAHAPSVLDAGLLVASPMNKRKAARFLEGVTSTGSTDPIPGIEAAFRVQPDLIYLLTDGDFPDNDAVLARIRVLNKGKNVRVNTIAFVGSGDSDTAFIDLLKKIAAETGGNYRHVSEEDLQ